jgi:ferrous iron transport protein B
VIGEVIAVIFKPLGFGRWQAAVATILGLVAKEEIVGVFGSLSSMAGSEETNYAFIASEIFGGSKLSAYSFLMFNLLCAPCFAAMGAIRREMNSAKWTVGAIGYMCAFAYAVSLIVYQLGTFFVTSDFTVGTVAALVVLVFMMFMLFRKSKDGKRKIK